MRLPMTTCRLAVATGVLVGLAGCSSGPSELASMVNTQAKSIANSVHRPGWISPEASSARLLYASEYNTNEVLIFDQKGLSQVGDITDGVNGPEGLFVDSHGNLYATNNAGTVQFYKKGKTSPTITYSQGLSYPFDVVVGTDGYVYVMNFNSGNGLVVEYPPGSTIPTLSFTIGALGEGVALDNANDLYVSYRNGGSGSVLEFPPHSSNGTDLGLQGLSSNVGGLLIDENGDIVYADQGNGLIDIFPPGSTTATRTISTGGDPWRLTLNHDEKTLYVSNWSENELQSFTYANGKPVATVPSISGPIGVSASPSYPFGEPY